MERTLAEEIEECAGEKILSACLLRVGSISDPRVSYTRASGVTIRPGAAHDWGDVRDMLDYHGRPWHEWGADCDEVTAWSENWVLFIGAYDGRYWVTRVPRNPTDHSPHHVGGGG
jgi:hypothetical protein